MELRDIINEQLTRATAETTVFAKNGDVYAKIWEVFDKELGMQWEGQWVKEEQKLYLYAFTIDYANELILTEYETEEYVEFEIEAASLFLLWQKEWEDNLKTSIANA